MNTLQSAAPTVQSEWNLSASDLAAGLKRVMFAAEKPQWTTRYAMQCVLFDFTGNILHMVATDGRHLACQTLKDITAGGAGRGSHQCLMSIEAVKNIATWCRKAGKKATVTLRPTLAGLFFKVGEMAGEWGNADGRFPRYQEVFPGHRESWVTIDGKTLAGIMAEIKAHEGDADKRPTFDLLSFAGSDSTAPSVLFECEREGKVALSRHLPAPVEGSTRHVQLDASMLHKLLGAMGANPGPITINIIDDRNAVEITGPDGFRYVIMPLTVEGHSTNGRRLSRVGEKMVERLSSPATEEPAPVATSPISWNPVYLMEQRAKVAAEAAPVQDAPVVVQEPAPIVAEPPAPPAPIFVERSKPTLKPLPDGFPEGYVRDLTACLATMAEYRDGVARMRDTDRKYGGDGRYLADFITSKATSSIRHSMMMAVRELRAFIREARELGENGPAILRTLESMRTGSAPDPAPPVPDFPNPPQPQPSIDRQLTVKQWAPEVRIIPHQDSPKGRIHVYAVLYDNGPDDYLGYADRTFHPDATEYAIAFVKELAAELGVPCPPLPDPVPPISGGSPDAPTLTEEEQARMRRARLDAWSHPGLAGKAMVEVVATFERATLAGILAAREAAPEPLPYQVERFPGGFELVPVPTGDGATPRPDDDEPQEGDRSFRGDVPETIDIDRRTYGLMATPDGVELTSGKGTSYRITQGEHGPECECPAFRYMHAGLPTEGCKHIRSLRLAGLLHGMAHIRPIMYNASGPETVNPRAALNTATRTGVCHVACESYHPRRVSSSRGLPALPSGERWERVDLDPDTGAKESDRGSVAQDEAQPAEDDGLCHRQPQERVGRKALHQNSASPRLGSVRWPETAGDGSPSLSGLQQGQQPTLQFELGDARGEQQGLQHSGQDNTGNEVPPCQIDGIRHPDYPRDVSRGGELEQDRPTIWDLRIERPEDRPTGEVETRRLTVCRWCGWPSTEELCRECSKFLPRPEDSAMPDEQVYPDPSPGFSGILAAYGLHAISGGAPEEEDDDSLQELAEHLKRIEWSRAEAVVKDALAELDRLKAINAELLEAQERAMQLLQVAGWYVNYFWETTNDSGHREKAWEHMQEIEAMTGKRI